MQQDIIEDFAKNIRYVCGYYKSVSDVCRKTGINRSQFGKYISGTIMPSPYILRKICDFFGVDYREIILPHSDFKRIFESNHGSLGVNKNNTLSVPIKSNDKALSIYLGYYHCYKISMINDAQVVKSVMFISREKSDFSVNYIERSSERRHRYKGCIYYVGDRIFINAYDSIFDSELLSMVMYPSNTTKVSILSGLCMGVTSDIKKTLNCVRIVFVKIPHITLVKDAISQCGVFDKYDVVLPEIARLLLYSDTQLPEKISPLQIEASVMKK